LRRLALVLGLFLGLSVFSGCESTSNVAIKAKHYVIGAPAVRLQNDILMVKDGKVIMLVDDIYLGDIVKLRTNLEAMQRAGLTELELYVNSNGGALVVMFAMVELLEEAKANGLHITSYCPTIAASAAVPLFLVGDYREIRESTCFMIHPHSLIGKENYATEGSPTRETLFNKMSTYWNKKYAEYVSSKTYLSYDEVYEMMIQFNSSMGQNWFTSEELLEYRFAHKIRGNNEY